LVLSSLLYKKPDEAVERKFSLVYHTDNFNVRVAKLVEYLYRLLALVVGVSTRKISTKEARELIEHRLYLSKLEGIATTLEAFQRNPRIKHAIDARHLFVHYYREEPRSKPKWGLLEPASRLHEVRAGDDLGEQVRRLTEIGDLDRYADRKADELRQTLKEIRAFRYRLHGVFEGFDPSSSVLAEWIEQAVRGAGEAVEGADEPGASGPGAVS
jgi:hypothetical protein